MNKKPTFREKIKLNSRGRKETANEDNIHNNVKEKSSLEKINSYSTLSKQFSKFKRHMQILQSERGIYKRKHICEDCAMLDRHIASGKRDEGNNTQVDKKILDVDYIDGLVSKIRELKNRVSLFENHYGLQTVLHNSAVCMCHYQSENGTIGDYDVPKPYYKHSKDKFGLRFSHDDMHVCGDIYRSPFYFYKRAKTFSDRQRSIYTNNEPIIAHTLVQEGFTKISKNQKNKSNASIVKSIHSINHHTDFVKVNSHLNSKHFQAAAEEFIEQAEELKTKIGYILECCGYATPTMSSFSESRIPSEFNCRTANNTTNNTHSVDTLDDALSDPHLKNLFETVSSQYREILDSLVSIESEIKTLHKRKPRTKKSGFSEEFFAGIPNKVREKTYKSATLPGRKITPPPPPHNHIPMDTKKSLPRNSDHNKPFKLGISNKMLEPVVMVYEPIHPEYYVDDVPKTPFKERRDDPKQKYGFVVTYTPDISPESEASVADLKNGKKNKKVIKKKKILPCFGF